MYTASRASIHSPAFPSPTPVGKQAPPPYGHPRGVLDIPRKICSVQELNLLLEVLRYEQPPDWETCYKEILNLIGESRFDAVSRAKIYPKAVFYLCREGLSRGAWGLAEKTAAMAHCEKAVQLFSACFVVLPIFLQGFFGLCRIPSGYQVKQLLSPFPARVIFGKAEMFIGIR